MKIAYITNFKDMSCLNVQRELHVEIKQVDNENGHRHGHGGDDAGDEHKLLNIFLHIHSLLKNSLFSIFFYSPYQITVRIVHSLDTPLLAVSVQSAKLRTIIKITIVSEK